MPAPFLATLTASARAAYPFIQRGVREGLSSRALERVIRAAGLAIRRQDLLTAMRLESGVQTQGSELRFLNQDHRPNPARLPIALTKIRRQYSFIVEVSGVNVSTGELTRRNVTVTSDSLLTRREIEAAAVDAVDSQGTRYGMRESSGTLTSGMQSGSFGTF